MSTFDYIVLFIVGIAAITYLFARHARIQDERWEYVNQKPGRFKIWNCKRKNHAGHAHTYLSKYGNGCFKIRCEGCGTVFMEGQKIVRRIRISK